LSLTPAVADRCVLWVGMDSILKARALLVDCDAQYGDMLEGFEVIPQHCLAAVLDHLPDARSPLQQTHAWYALIELVAEDGNTRPLTDVAERILESAFDQGQIQDGTIAANETQAEAFWQLRDSISAAERAIGPAMQHDISVPVADMARFIDECIPEVERAFPRCTAAAFGHLGDGNVHFHVLAQPDAVPGEWEEQEGQRISRFVHDAVTRWGGSISAEHGIGQMKREELGRLGDPAALSIMRAVKKALDPQNLMNPGKLVPPD
ncbi:MAG: FAD-binding oxidoreductase, partial [Pontixanthobacter sp.]